jgi:hypothetical protein
VLEFTNISTMKYFLAIVIALWLSGLFAQNSPEYYISLGNTTPLQDHVKPTNSSNSIKSGIWKETFDVGMSGPGSTAGRRLRPAMEYGQQ